MMFYKTRKNDIIYKFFAILEALLTDLTVMKINPIQKQSPVDVLGKRCSSDFAEFTGKHLYQSLFLIKLQA